MIHSNLLEAKNHQHFSHIVAFIRVKESAIFVRMTVKLFVPNALLTTLNMILSELITMQ
jgi:hypothetical protein